MPNLRRRKLAICIAAAALAVAAIRYEHEPPAIDEQYRKTTRDTSATQPKKSRQPPNAITTRIQPEAFARSLRGTQHDGRLRADDQGNLVVERGMRDLFDYYLTTLGEHDLEAIRAQLLTLFHQQLPAPAAQQATQLLDAYLQYRQRSGELQNDYPTLTDENAAQVVADYFDARAALRHALFDAQAADAFFASDATNEQAAQHNLRALSERQQGMAVGDATDNASSDNYTLYRETTISATEMDATTRDALRNELFGHEAAGRLSSLDQRRSDWNRRVKNYREQKQQLLIAAAEAGIDASTQLQQLQRSQFNSHEIQRLRALDRLQQQGLEIEN